MGPPQLQNLVYEEHTPTNLTQMPSTVGASRSMIKGMGVSASLPRPKTGGNKKENESNLVTQAKQQL